MKNSIMGIFGRGGGLGFSLKCHFSVMYRVYYWVLFRKTQFIDKIQFKKNFGIEVTS